MSTYNSVFKKDLLKDEVILVTGGGTGIGRCISHELASLGAQVIIAARKQDQLTETAKEIQSLGGKCDTLTLNIRDTEGATRVINEIVKKYGKLTGLVNNAGGQFVSPASMLSVKGFSTVVDLNLNGTFNMCKAAFEGYMGEHGGKIVNIVAECRNGFPRMAHTGAARAGIINLTKTLAIEWGPYNGIRVNCVAPGTIISSGMKNYPDSVASMVADNDWQSPSGRFGTESEVAASVVFLMTPAAAYINGINLAVDGGSSLSKGFPEGQDLAFNPEGSRMKAYVGWPDQIPAVDAPAKFVTLLNKYKAGPSKL